jgi:hypothetical protein
LLSLVSLVPLVTLGALYSLWSYWPNRPRRAFRTSRARGTLGTLIPLGAGIARATNGHKCDTYQNRYDAESLPSETDGHPSPPAGQHP